MVVGLIKHVRCGFSVPDILALLLLAWYGMPVSHLLPLLVMYFALKPFLCGRLAATRALAFLAVCVWTILEAGLGLMQLSGLRASNHAAFPITGSFDNPGPYGGFIAIGMSVALAYLASCSRRTRGFYRITMTAFAVSALVLGFLVLPASMSRAAWLSFAVSAVYFLSGNKTLRSRLKDVLPDAPRRIIAAAAASLLLVAAAGATFLIKADSAVGRLHIWHMEILAIAKRPIAGSGPGSAMGAYGQAQEEFFRTHPNAPAGIVRVAGCPEYPFNEYLGIGMERGIPGLLLAAGIAASAILNLHKRKNVFAAGMLALAVFAMFSYPLSITGFRILLVLFLASCGPTGRRGTKAELMLALAALTACVASAVALKPVADERKDAELEWKRIAQFINYGPTEADAMQMRALYAELSDNYRFLYDLGYILHRTGHFAESSRILAEGAAISSDPMFRIIMGRNLESEGDYAGAEEEYLRAHYMVPCRIYPLLRLMRLHIRTGNDEGAALVAEKISAMPINRRNASMVRLRREAMEALDSLNRCRSSR